MRSPAASARTVSLAMVPAAFAVKESRSFHLRSRADPRGGGPRGDEERGGADQRVRGSERRTSWRTPVRGQAGRRHRGREAPAGDGGGVSGAKIVPQGTIPPPRGDIGKPD